MEIVLDSIEGISDEQLVQMKEALHDLVINKLSVDLDITRLEKIYIPNDFGESVVDFQKSNGLSVGYTNNEMGVAGGKTLSYGEIGEQKNVIFLQQGVFLSLFDPDSSQIYANLIHHELCHVHDNLNKEKMGKFIREYDNPSENYLTNVTKHHSMIIWDEYIAPRLSAKTFPVEEGLNMDYLLDLIEYTEKNIGDKVNQYRIRGNIDLLFKEVQELSNPMMKIAATVIGNFDGLGLNEENELKIMAQMDECIDQTTFKPIWPKLKIALRNLYAKYPNWKGISVFDELNQLVIETWKVYGIITEDRGDRAYIDVPFK
ncbi:hypothetical protein JNUCC23_01915 [Peribacillus sp. JNUCC 23]